MESRFIVSYCRVRANVIDCRIFRTLKELSDWLNSNEEVIVITSIDEIPG